LRPAIASNGNLLTIFPSYTSTLKDSTRHGHYNLLVQFEEYLRTHHGMEVAGLYSQEHAWRQIGSRQVSAYLWHLISLRWKLSSAQGHLYVIQHYCKRAHAAGEIDETSLREILLLRVIEHSSGALTLVDTPTMKKASRARTKIQQELATVTIENSVLSARFSPDEIPEAKTTLLQMALLIVHVTPQEDLVRLLLPFRALLPHEHIWSQCVAVLLEWVDEELRLRRR